MKTRTFKVFEPGETFEFKGERYVAVEDMPGDPLTGCGVCDLRKYLCREEVGVLCSGGIRGDYLNVHFEKMEGGEE